MEPTLLYHGDHVEEDHSVPIRYGEYYVPMNQDIESWDCYDAEGGDIEAVRKFVLGLKSKRHDESWKDDQDRQRLADVAAFWEDWGNQHRKDEKMILVADGFAETSYDVSRIEKLRQKAFEMFQAGTLKTANKSVDIELESVTLSDYAEYFIDHFRSLPAAALTAIPGSDPSQDNMVTKIVKLLCSTFPERFAEGPCLKQFGKRKAEHESSGRRFPGSHLSGWSVAKENRAELTKRPLIIVDDVMTTGGSFEDAACFLTNGDGVRHLENPWKRWNIRCFAFAKTVSGGYFDERPAEEPDASKYMNPHGRNTLVIWDFDNTLLNTRKLNNVFFGKKDIEEVKAHTGKDNPSYYACLRDKLLRSSGEELENYISVDDDLIRTLNIMFGNSLPGGGRWKENTRHVILTKRSRDIVKKIRGLGEYAGKGLPAWKKLPPRILKCIAYTESEEIGRKPSWRPVMEVIKETYNYDIKHGGNGFRYIVGIGNQETDILAYARAGIIPVMAEWFNEAELPVQLREQSMVYEAKRPDDLRGIFEKICERGGKNRS
ncbi:MAG: hypothetical protein PUC44_01420 [Eubacteriales bacterium]|nr:hypothetical protein [Eubacteriales bacterium]